MIWVVVFVGLAVLGTLARALISQRLNSNAFPYGTLFINVAGSFALGLLANASPNAATSLGTAGLGSFTTFSTLAHQSISLGAHKRVFKAASYLTISVVAGIIAAWAGLALAS